MTVDKVTSQKSSKMMILIIQSVLLLQIFAPLASASGMTSCSDSGGACDDYNSDHDETPNQQDWVNGTYDFKLIDTSKIRLDLTWAIHEFNRSALGLNIAAIESALAVDGLDSTDGAPADLIRNYFDDQLPGMGTNVSNKLISEVSNALETSLES